MCVCVCGVRAFVSVHKGPFQSISSCNNSDSIMLNAALRIKVVEEDVCGIQITGSRGRRWSLYREKPVLKGIKIPAVSFFIQQRLGLCEKKTQKTVRSDIGSSHVSASSKGLVHPEFIFQPFTCHL